jgi:hypothetical protein
MPKSVEEEEYKGFDDIKDIEDDDIDLANDIE